MSQNSHEIDRSPFKAGDYVRCINYPFDLFDPREKVDPRGKVGRIDAIDLYVEVIMDIGLELFHSDELELLTETEAVLARLRGEL